MFAVFLPNVSREQKTFTVAMALLGTVAAMQILAALYLYTRQKREAAAVVMRSAVETRLLSSAQPTPAATPAATVPVIVSAAPGVPQTTARRAEPAPASVTTALLQMAKGFRGRGDTTNAIAKLQQATALDPGNAEALAELAMTYESMQLFNRSNEVWRRLQALGAGVGPLYELADLKLRVGVPTGGNTVTAEAASAAAGVHPDDLGVIPEGSTFGISEVTLKPEKDPDAETRLLLRVGVKARPDTPIDHTKVKLQVFFYDMVNNDQVVLTDADVSYEWVTPGHDWAETGTEVLDVTYYRSKQTGATPGIALADVPDSVEKATKQKKRKGVQEAPPPAESGPHQYLGYIVRVYYKDQLQAVRAEPTRLLNLFPPPFTAPP